MKTAIVKIVRGSFLYETVLDKFEYAVEDIDWIAMEQYIHEDVAPKLREKFPKLSNTYEKTFTNNWLFMKYTNNGAFDQIAISVSIK